MSPWAFAAGASPAGSSRRDAGVEDILGPGALDDGPIPRPEGVAARAEAELGCVRGPRACVVRDANMGHRLANGHCSWCPELESRTTHRLWPWRAGRASPPRRRGSAGRATTPPPPAACLPERPSKIGNAARPRSQQPSAAAARTPAGWSAAQPAPPAHRVGSCGRSPRRAGPSTTARAPPPVGPPTRLAA